MLNRFATKALVSAQTRRGAGFIEWALLAVVALVLFVLLKGRLASLFSGIIDGIQGETV
ncbi:MAG: hypothetical protein GY882_01750 [Actinomycetia bacterium]|nr:hypothetical protein [Actinomycetes bacterium]MCP4844895.1 hypothetical protein [Actinomycetes bacterium]